MRKKPGKQTQKPIHPPKEQPLPEVHRSLPPPLSRKANLIVISVLFVWAILLYGNTVFNAYAIDDSLIINNDIAVQGFKALPGIFTSYLVDESRNVGGQRSEYRPVAKATMAIECGLWGRRPGPSHAINILIYFILSLVLFYTLRRMLINYNILFPFLIVLLFMAHPIHTEVVASLKNRDEMLAFLFGISGMYTLLNYGYTHRSKYLILACLYFVLGCVSKASVAPMFILYALTLYYFTDIKPSKITAVGAVLFITMLAAVLIPVLMLPPTFRTNFYFENALYFEKSIWVRLGTAMLSLLFYLRILIYPWPLLYYYGYNMIPLSNLGNPWVILTIIIYGGALIYAFRNFRKRTFLSFAILWYLISIFGYSNLLVPVPGIVGERFLFLGSVGFVMIIVYFLFRIFKTDPKSLTIELDSRIKIIAIAAIFLLPYGVLSFRRNFAWKNATVLFQSDIPHLENSAKANYQYAGYLMQMVYTDQNFLRYGVSNEFLRETIKKHFHLSLKVNPKEYNTLNDLGTAFLFIEKRYDSALYYFQKTIALDSSLTPAWVNMGMAYRQLGNYPKSMECYRKVLQIEPRQIKAYFAMADLYNDMGNVTKAVKMNEAIIEKYPDFDMPYINIGNYHMLKNDTAGAVQYWEKAAAINPSAEICMQLSVLFKMHSDYQKSQYYYNLGQQAIQKARQR
jgi:tetratricopeptide (TPR) repeat protein